MKWELLVFAKYLKRFGTWEEKKANIHSFTHTHTHIIYTFNHIMSDIDKLKKEIEDVKAKIKKAEDSGAQFDHPGLIALNNQLTELLKKENGLSNTSPITRTASSQGEIAVCLVGTYRSLYMFPLVSHR